MFVLFVGMSKATYTHSEYAALHFLLSYGKSGYTDPLQYFIRLTLPVLLHNCDDMFRFCINRANVILSTNTYIYLFMGFAFIRETNCVFTLGGTSCCRLWSL